MNTLGHTLQFRRNRFRFLLAALLLWALGPVQAAEPTHALAEEGYLGELPVVLSVTRLAQTLADTPGAVTIIDRDMIRRSGAREVSDVLRFVPGFVVSNAGTSGANPAASYHVALDHWGSRMQVFIDGRSVYSSLYLGDTRRGLDGVILEDIERIEVLRGSNSAAYGANAFLGVINIVTRNSADTHGALASVTVGNQGVKDNVVRYGWGNEDQHFRISTSRSSDSGTNAFVDPSNVQQLAYDDKRISQLHLRGDLRLPGGDELLVKAGNTLNSYGTGNVYDTQNPLRLEESRANYVQAHWNHQLAANESVALSASFDDEMLKSDFLYRISAFPLPPSPFSFPATTVRIGTSGYSQRHNLEFSHTLQPAQSLRTVWGVSWRHESVDSQQVFYQQPYQQQRILRLFGNAEWRPAEKWVINAGGMEEEHSIVGHSFSPRLMANYQVLPEHTLRIGATQATRSPTLVETHGDARIYVNNPLLPSGRPLIRLIAANGAVRPERITSREIGYLGEFREAKLSADIRAYWENLHGLIVSTNYVATNPAQIAPLPLSADFINGTDLSLRGIEQQWQWKPTDGTRFLLTHAYSQISSDESIEGQKMLRRVPLHSGSLMWLQKLPRNLDFSLMYTRMSAIGWGSTQSNPAYQQVDLRLAYPFRIGSTQAEAAITTQAINGDHLEGNTSVLVSRRCFATLRLEY